MDAAWISAITALGGVALGAVLTRNGEYRKWLRGERHKAATELLATGEAMRRALVVRRLSILSEKKGNAEQTRLEKEILTDQERIALALEAFRLVFPRRIAGLADEFVEAARAVARLPLDEQPSATAPKPGQQYLERRAALIRALSPLIAPDFRERLRGRRTPSWASEPKQGAVAP